MTQVPGIKRCITFTMSLACWPIYVIELAMRSVPELHSVSIR